MTAPNKKPPAAIRRLPTATSNPISISPSSRGRRAIASLWNASRIVSGALLTSDDLALITEALTEIAKAVRP